MSRKDFQKSASHVRKATVAGAESMSVKVAIGAAILLHGSVTSLDNYTVDRKINMAD